MPLKVYVCAQDLYFLNLIINKRTGNLGNSLKNFTMWYCSSAATGRRWSHCISFGARRIWESNETSWSKTKWTQEIHSTGEFLEKLCHCACSIRAITNLVKFTFTCLYTVAINKWIPAECFETWLKGFQFPDSSVPQFGSI